MPEHALAAQRRVFGGARSRAVWRWQLMLAISVVVIAGVQALLTPSVFADLRFLLALGGIVLLTLVALSARWECSSSYAILVIPVLDIIAICFLNAGSDAPIAFLWVFPIAWIATYYRPVVLLSTLILIGGLMLVEFAADNLAADQAINLIMLLITLGFIGATIATGSQRNRSTKRLLHAQSRRIESALHRVTEQKARTQRLLDSLDIGVARVGEEGLLELANQRFQELYSFDEAGQFSLTRAVEYRARRGTPTPLTWTTIARASRGELFANELVWLFGIDGKWRALRASTRVIGDGQYIDDGILLIVEEVTEEVDPQASHGAAMRLISHELRNPLTAVLGHVDLLLEREDLAPAARRQAEVIERAGDRMQVLIDRALAVDGPDEEDGDVEFDLASTAVIAADAFAPAAESNMIRLQTQLDEPLTLVGDVFRIRQVIDNVLSNAIKYSQRGGTVTIRGWRDDELVVLEVADAGIGISAEDLPHVFDPEFRAPSARESAIPGTGLGLSISRDIAEQCGGALEMRSELGQGTTVTISLPDRARRPQP